MKASNSSSCLALCVAVVLGAPSMAAAQSGLRLAPAVPTDEARPPVLRFHADTLSSHDIPGLISGPTLDSAFNTPNMPSSNARGSALWADWRPMGNGLKTSVGLVWRDSLLRESLTATDFAMGGFDGGGRGVTTPFLGLGWTSDSRRDGWRLSAEVGAYATAGDDCHGSVYRCAASTGMGLKPRNNQDGIRWTPYFSLGVSLQY